MNTHQTHVAYAVMVFAPGSVIIVPLVQEVLDVVGFVPSVV